MSQIYSDPTRDRDRHALPDIEVFYVSPMEAQYNCANADHAEEYTITNPGWYWWACLPGCLPDSSPVGPFSSEAEAIEDAQW